MKCIQPELKKLLEKQSYAFTGEHSAIKVCEWTKKSLKDEDFCYKEKFYGISSHKCCQMSPSIGFCQNRCIICWRPIEYTIGNKMKTCIDNPEDIIKNSILAQRKQLIGFKGNKKCNLKKLEEAMNPDQFAISLSGEPLLYPKLNELIKKLKKRKCSVFVVSNGLEPEILKKIEPPTQLYLSVDAPNEQLFNKFDQPQIKGSWKRLMKSLNILKKLKKKTRTVLRITLVKGMNMIYPKKYADLIKKADPDFVEVKSYMCVGASRNRLRLENMPPHQEVKEFSKEIVRYCSLKILDEKQNSRVVLLGKKKSMIKK